MLKVLIADDHAIFRDGLKLILKSVSEIKTIDEVASFSELFEILKNTEYDILILDITMPDGNIMETLTILKKDYPGLPVLILSMHPEEQYASRLFKMGISGYLTKDSASENLINAIKIVSSGETYIKPELEAKLKNTLMTKPHDSLSNREYQVMLMLKEGKTLTEISQDLSISIKTVSTLKSRLFEKLELKDNYDLIRYMNKWF